MDGILDLTAVAVQIYEFIILGQTVRGVVSFVNANDGCCEGIDYPTLKAFSVQFYPDSCMGMFDKLFGKFTEYMGGDEDAAE